MCLEKVRMGSNGRTEEEEQIMRTGETGSFNCLLC